ncbi:hypothetical protein Tco_1186391 [Tanacetum coccineum]
MSAKLDKARYGLKQVLEAWYETLSTYLTEHNFVRGIIDNTKVSQLLPRISKFENLKDQFKINTEEYIVNDLLRKYDKIGSISVNTPIMPPDMLGPDLNCKAVNESQYKGACQLLEGKLGC